MYTMRWLLPIYLLILASSANAATTVTLVSGSFSRTVAVSDLETLAVSGEAQNLDVIFAGGAFNKESLQKALISKLQLSVIDADNVFNSKMGRKILAELSEGLRPTAASTQDIAIKALRSALVQSCEDDGAATLIEVLKYYPTGSIVVDISKLKGIIPKK